MDIPRGICYVIAILIIILAKYVSVAVWYCFKFLGGICMIWAVYTGWKKKSLKAFQKIEQENQKLKLDQMKKDALQNRDYKEE